MVYCEPGSLTGWGELSRRLPCRSMPRLTRPDAASGARKGMVAVTGTLGRFEELVHAIAHACRAHFGERLVSVAVFGSVGRGVPRPDSDVDLLIIVDDLPRGRLARQEAFAPVEQALEPMLKQLRSAGVWTELSPILKTRDEAEAGSPLFLDMVEDARILVDREGFLTRRLARLRERLAQLGARRIAYGGAWYWDLKPDFRPGEVIDL